MHTERCKLDFSETNEAQNYITNNLRVIHHAWHFWFVFSPVFTASKLSVVVAWFTP